LVIVLLYSKQLLSNPLPVHKILYEIEMCSTHFCTIFVDFLYDFYSKNAMGS